MNRQQSSIEFLLTYAWAFLSIAVFLAFILIVVTTTNPASYNPPTCYISPGLNCITAVLTTNSLGSKFTILFTDNLGQPITFPQNALTLFPGVGVTNYTGNCVPANALKGSLVTCNATTANRISQVGAQVNPKFTINYELCSPICSYPVVSSNTINTTGFATLQVSPYTTNPIINLTLLDSPTSGQIIVNGVSYPSNNILYFVNNLGYSVYGSPPNGYIFSNWIVTGGVSVASSVLQSTTARATARGTLTATFITTTSTTSTSTSSSSSTTTAASTSTSSTSTSSTSTTSTTTSTSTSTSTTTIPQTSNLACGSFAGDIVYSSGTTLTCSVIASNAIFVNGVTIDESGHYMQANVLFQNTGTITDSHDGGAGGAGGPGQNQPNDPTGAGTSGSAGLSRTSAFLSVSLTGGTGGVGGGSGAEGYGEYTTGLGGAGGAGGNGGGIVEIYGGNFVNTGTISAAGSSGTSGSSSSTTVDPTGMNAASPGGGGGGGAGGAGGTIFIGYTNSFVQGTTSVSAGSGGSGAGSEAVTGGCSPGQNCAGHDQSCVFGDPGCYFNYGGTGGSNGGGGGGGGMLVLGQVLPHSGCGVGGAAEGSGGGSGSAAGGATGSISCTVSPYAGAGGNGGSGSGSAAGQVITRSSWSH